MTDVHGVIGQARQKMYNHPWQEARTVADHALDSVVDAAGAQSLEGQAAHLIRKATQQSLVPQTAFRANESALNDIDKGLHGPTATALSTVCLHALKDAVTLEDARNLGNVMLQQLEHAPLKPEEQALALTAQNTAAAYLRPEPASKAQKLALQMLQKGVSQPREVLLPTYGLRAMQETCQYADDQKNIGDAVLKSISRQLPGLPAQVAQATLGTCKTLDDFDSASVHLATLTALKASPSGALAPILAAIGVTAQEWGNTKGEIGKVFLKAVANQVSDPAAAGALRKVSDVGSAEAAKVALKWAQYPQEASSDRMRLARDARQQADSAIATATSKIADLQKAAADLQQQREALNPLLQQHEARGKHMRIAIGVSAVVGLASIPCFVLPGAQPIGFVLAGLAGCGVVGSAIKLSHISDDRYHVVEQQMDLSDQAQQKEREVDQVRSTEAPHQKMIAATDALLEVDLERRRAEAEQRLQKMVQPAGQAGSVEEEDDQVTIGNVTIRT
ncbi:MAG: hypothetical protein ACYCW6_03930 [Candidatus Xenobia bacterium]